MREAIAACESKGLRLPTIRELAQLAKQNGAQGILEISHTGSETPEGYSSVKALTTGKGTDEFYYSAAGYKDAVRGQVGKFNLVGMSAKPEEIVTVEAGANPAGFLVYWSSSETVGRHNEADPEQHSFYVLDVNGDIHDHYRSVKGLVRCLRNPTPPREPAN